MKFGFRTPSLKKSISARTTGRLNRAIKKAIIPEYDLAGNLKKLYTTRFIERQPLECQIF